MPRLTDQQYQTMYNTILLKPAQFENKGKELVEKLKSNSDFQEAYSTLLDMKEQIEDRKYSVPSRHAARLYHDLGNDIEVFLKSSETDQGLYIKDHIIVEDNEGKLPYNYIGGAGAMIIDFHNACDEVLARINHYISLCAENMYRDQPGKYEVDLAKRHIRFFGQQNHLIALLRKVASKIEKKKPLTKDDNHYKEVVSVLENNIYRNNTPLSDSKEKNKFSEAKDETLYDKYDSEQVNDFVDMTCKLYQILSRPKESQTELI